MSGRDRSAAGIRITWIGFLANLLLTVAKIISGIIGSSSAMIADGVHSLSDISTDIAVIFGLKTAEKPVDEDHDFGHGKFETLVAAFIGLFLLGIALGILLSSGKVIWNFLEGRSPEKPGWIAVGAAFLSIVVKEVLYQFTIKTAEKIDSKALKANAWHHRTDAFSSVAVLIGVGGAIILGGKWTVLDPLAAAVVSVLIIIVALGLLKESVMELSEASLDSETEERILSIISSVRGAKEPHNLKTRKIGSEIAVDVHIKAPGDMPLKQAHDISIEVERKIKIEFGENTYIHVHMDPDDV